MGILEASLADRHCPVQPAALWGYPDTSSAIPHISQMGHLYCIKGKALTVWRASLYSGGFYSRNDGKTWILTMLLTGTLFPTMCLSIAFVLNFIAIGYHSLAAVPFGSILIVLIGWIFISFPLCLCGTVSSLFSHLTQLCTERLGFFFFFFCQSVYTCFLPLVLLFSSAAGIDCETFDVNYHDSHECWCSL